MYLFVFAVWLKMCINTMFAYKRRGATWILCSRFFKCIFLMIMFCLRCKHLHTRYALRVTRCTYLHLVLNHSTAILYIYISIGGLDQTIQMLLLLWVRRGEFKNIERHSTKLTENRESELEIGNKHTDSHALRRILIVNHTMNSNWISSIFWN